MWIFKTEKLVNFTTILGRITNLNMRGCFRQVRSRKASVRVKQTSSMTSTKPMFLPPIQSSFSQTENDVSDESNDGKEGPLSGPQEVLTYYRSLLALSSNNEIKLMRGKLLGKLPIYKEHQIHRPASDKKTTEIDGVLLDLVEQGFVESAEYLQKLFHFEIEFRSVPDNIGRCNNWPWLCKTETLLSIVISSLRGAELARRNEKRLLEVAAWFHLSVFTAVRKECWHWLSDMLFKQCLKVCKILRTGVKREASIRFTYAQFLSEKLNLQVEALRQYNIVRRMTLSKLFEGLDLLHLNEFNSDLHSQSCYYMNKVCLQLARKMRQKNPYMSVQLSEKAHEFLEIALVGRGGKLSDLPDRHSAICELVLSLIASQEYTTAIGKLNAVQAKCRQLFDPKGFCKALYLRAKCYQLMNKRDLAIGDLRVLCEIALKCRLEDLSVLAELEYAELLLTLGSKNRIETLRNAAYAFLTAHNDPDRNVRQRARCLIGIAEGLYLWPFFKDMVIGSQRNREDLSKLIEWKFCKTPFMKKQVQAFSLQIPKNGVLSASVFVQQIQKFVFPENFFEIGEKYFTRM